MRGEFDCAAVSIILGFATGSSGSIAWPSYTDLRAPGFVIRSLGWSGSLGLALPDAAWRRTLAAGRTLEAGADFSQIEAQLGHCAAEGVAVHPQLFAALHWFPRCRKDFAQILPLEFLTASS